MHDNNDVLNNIKQRNTFIKTVFVILKYIETAKI